MTTHINNKDIQLGAFLGLQRLFYCASFCHIFTQFNFHEIFLTNMSQSNTDPVFLKDALITLCNLVNGNDCQSKTKVIDSGIPSVIKRGIF
eukprot:Awhi_evm1s11396